MARRVLRDFFLRQPFAAGDVLDDDQCRRLEDAVGSLERKGYISADAPAEQLPPWPPPAPPEPEPKPKGKPEGAARPTRAARGT